VLKEEKNKVTKQEKKKTKYITITPSQIEREKRNKQSTLKYSKNLSSGP